MKAASETYKGIEYIRISSLPENQREEIWTSFNHELIIRILVNDSLFNDCIQFSHYSSWYDCMFAAEHVKTVISTASESFDPSRLSLQWNG